MLEKTQNQKENENKRLVWQITGHPEASAK